MRTLTALTLLLAAGSAGAAADSADLVFAPAVPAPIARKAPATLKVHLETKELQMDVADGLDKPTSYMFWTFNSHVPGPFLRARVGDTLDLTITNPADSSMDHSIDLHAVTGPGGGAKVTLVKPGQTKEVLFKLLNPGLYVYHCAAPPVTDHIANGMFGLILVEPAEGLPKVDREFYIMQSEIYTKEEAGTEGLVHFSHDKALMEQPTYVVFNGRVGGLQDERRLNAKVGESVRVYFGNAGPNLISSWHIIGVIFDQVWNWGGIGADPARNVQTVLVPAGGSSIAQFTMKVPGDYTIVDHSIFRLEQGAMGTLHADGPEDLSIYPHVAPPKPESKP